MPRVYKEPRSRPTLNTLARAEIIAARRGLRPLPATAAAPRGPIHFFWIEHLARVGSATGKSIFFGFGNGAGLAGWTGRETHPFFRISQFGRVGSGGGGGRGESIFFGFSICAKRPNPFYLDLVPVPIGGSTLPALLKHQFSCNKAQRPARR